MRLSSKVGDYSNAGSIIDRQQIQADGGETVFNLTFIDGAEEVYLNGARLMKGALRDYTTSPSKITLNAALATGDDLLLVGRASANEIPYTKSVSESVVLTDEGQTEVIFSSIETESIELYVSGNLVDRGRLTSPQDFELRAGSTSTIDLKHTYPAGTIIEGVQGGRLSFVDADSLIVNDGETSKSLSDRFSKTQETKQYFIESNGAQLQDLVVGLVLKKWRIDNTTGIPMEDDYGQYPVLKLGKSYWNPRIAGEQSEFQVITWVSAGDSLVITAADTVSGDTFTLEYARRIPGIDDQLTNVARANNVRDNEVAFLREGTVSGIRYFYDANSQVTYSVSPAISGEITAIGVDVSGVVMLTVDGSTVDVVNAVDYGSVSEGTIVKHRRGTNAEIMSDVPALGELLFNTTDNSIHMGDGAREGGHSVLLQSIARSLNVTDSDVGYANEGLTVTKILYDSPTQTTWSAPADAIGKIIQSVVSDQLTTTEPAVYTLVGLDKGKYLSNFSSVQKMIDKSPVGGDPYFEHILGNQYSTGDTNWRVVSTLGVDLGGGLFASPISSVCMDDFGLSESGDNSQIILDAAEFATSMHTNQTGKDFEILSDVTLEKDINIKWGDNRYFGAQFTIIGSELALSNAIQADIAVGDFEFNVDTNTDINEGDIIQILDTADYSFSLHRPVYKQGEFAKVLRSALGVVTLESFVRGKYAALTSVLRKVSLLDVDMDGGTFDNVGGASSYAFRATNCTGKININDTSGGASAAVNINRCYGLDFNLRDSNHKAANVGTNYGIVITDSQAVEVHARNSHGTRHGISTGTVGTNPVVNRDININGANISSEEAQGADFHGNAENCYYKDCRISNGFNLAGKDCGYIDCDVIAGRFASSRAPYQFAEVVGGEMLIRGGTVTIPAEASYPLARNSSTADAGFYSSDVSFVIKGMKIDCGKNWTAGVFINIQNQSPGIKISSIHIDDIDLINDINANFDRILLGTLGNGALRTENLHIGRISRNRTIDRWMVNTGGFLASGSHVTLPTQSSVSYRTVAAGNNSSTADIIDFIGYPFRPIVTHSTFQNLTGSAVMLGYLTALSTVQMTLQARTADFSNAPGDINVDIMYNISMNDYIVP